MTTHSIWDRSTCGASASGVSLACSGAAGGADAIGSPACRATTSARTIAAAYPSHSTELCRLTPTNGSSTPTYATSPTALAMFDAAYSRWMLSGADAVRASHTWSSGDVADSKANGRPIPARVVTVTHSTGGQPGRG